MNKVAILIDGGFYLKQLPNVRKDIDQYDPEKVATSIRQLVRGHLSKLAIIQKSYLFNSAKKRRELILEPHGYAQHYRTFYYDARPLIHQTVTPISRQNIDFGKSDAYRFRTDLFNELRNQRNLALRLGETKADPNYIWKLRPKVLESLVKKEKDFSSLSDDDFQTTIRQKGVDMRMGLDMASIALKKQANIFVLVTGDADFVPAAKLVRREGCQVILNPLKRNVPSELFEHIDGLESGFWNNHKRGEDDD